MEDLFETVSVGACRLRNRIVMAPLTRARAGNDGTPTPLMSEYYAQRASAGLIVTESTHVCPRGRSHTGTPGLHRDEHALAWSHVVQAVHAREGCIFVQLNHAGRLSHPSLHPDGAWPVAPSAIAARATRLTPVGTLPAVAPRPLSIAEIQSLIEDYRRAAILARAAGFDGVEIHAANGHLLEQFLRNSTNHRNDAYGGSVHNRSRLLIEIAQAVASVLGAGRVGVRLAPLGCMNDCAWDSNPVTLYAHVIAHLSELGLAYVHLIEGQPQGPREVPGGFDLQILRARFNGMLIANNGYDRALALQARRERSADLIAFGRAYIANPDLAERLRSDAPLNTPDRDTYFEGGSRGYTDYPTLDPAPPPARNGARNTPRPRAAGACAGAARRARTNAHSARQDAMPCRSDDHA